MSKFYITTPIYYVNDRAHVGHAYTTLAADVLVRWHKTKNDKVFFLTGTDEHGAKIAQSAAAAGKSEKEFVDEKTRDFKEAWAKLNIKYSNFLRTTDQSHINAVKNAVQYLYEKGLIYKGYYEGLYCLGCEQYKTPDDLVNGQCPEHQIEPQLMKEESYFFKLSQFEKVLKEKIERDKLEIEPKERKNETLGFINKGLKDISISRANVSWGIPLPFDENYTLFVWIDAFLNYLTGLDWNGKAGKKPGFFPPDIQLMSKDILRVHATIWPALLLALKFPLPKKIFVHGYFTVNGQKMSKSLGNVIWPEDLVEKFGIDGTRYLLMSSLSYGQDGDISWEKLREKYNADLASGLGNLVARVLTIAERIKIQTYSHIAVKEEIGQAWKNYKKDMEEFKFNEALKAIWDLISFCDKYIEKERPWEENKKQKEVISNLLFAINEIAKLLEPFLPETSEKILKQLKTTKSKILFPKLRS